MYIPLDKIGQSIMLYWLLIM